MIFLRALHSIMRQKFHEWQDSNPGPWGEKRQHCLCALPYPIRIYSTVSSTLRVPRNSSAILPGLIHSFFFFSKIDTGLNCLLVFPNGFDDLAASSEETNYHFRPRNALFRLIVMEEV